MCFPPPSGKQRGEATFRLHFPVPLSAECDTSSSAGGTRRASASLKELPRGALPGLSPGCLLQPQGSWVLPFRARHWWVIIASQSPRDGSAFGGPSRVESDCGHSPGKAEEWPIRTPFLLLGLAPHLGEAESVPDALGALWVYGV